MIKSIETEYNGYLFRSRLEARWAVFFDLCGVSYEYEPEGFDLGNGNYYLPDFCLHNVEMYDFEHEKGKISDVWVEVKAQLTPLDVIKFEAFSKKNLIMIITSLPKGNDITEIIYNISNATYENQEHLPKDCRMPLPFTLKKNNGNLVKIPCVNVEGKFELSFPEQYFYIDKISTELAYRIARQARFEYGETPFDLIKFIPGIKKYLDKIRGDIQYIEQRLQADLVSIDGLRVRAQNSPESLQRFYSKLIKLKEADVERQQKAWRNKQKYVDTLRKMLLDSRRSVNSLKMKSSMNYNS